MTDCEDLVLRLSDLVLKSSKLVSDPSNSVLGPLGVIDVKRQLEGSWLTAKLL